MSVAASKPVTARPSMRAGSFSGPRSVEPAPRERRTAGWLLVALVVMLALNGLDTAYSALTAPPTTPTVGQLVPTSFGFVRVASIETVEGLSAADLGGMTHGIPGLVDANHALVRATVTLENASTRAVPVTPDDFRLVVDADASNALAPSGATIGTVALPAESSLDASVMFVVPRGQAALELRYAPPGGEVVTVDGGWIDGSAPSDGEAHPNEAEAHP